MRAATSGFVRLAAKAGPIPLSFASLLATAKLNGIEPYAYLKDVLERMTHGHPISRIDDLLPWNWKASNVEN